MTAEERARTLTGRHQISDDGRHLVDGIPFGRPYLRNPRRPAVRIPPRKRQRLIEIDENTELAAQIENAAELHASPGISLLTNGDTSPGSSRAKTASKKVQFVGGELEDEDDSEEEDDDFVPGGEPDKDAAMDDNEDEDDEDDSDFGSDSDSDASSASDASSSDSDSDDTSSDSDSDSDSDASSPPEVRSSKGVLETPNRNPPSSPKHTAPGQGRMATKHRNSRRTRTNRLRHLKNIGKLPAGANLKDLDEYEAGQTSRSTDAPDAPRPFSTFEGKRKRIDDDEVEDNSAEGLAEFMQRKKELMAKFGEDEKSTTIQDGESLQEPAAAPRPASPEAIMEEEQPAKKETPKKRLRPDTSAISRILARQAMVSGLLQPACDILTYSQPSVKKSSKKAPVVVEPPEPEGASDPDFWKSRISLSAFECWEEEYELSAPLYPFKQHWDPASRIMKEKADKKKKKSQRNKQKVLPVQEEESEEEEKIFLDYDDTGATEDPEATTAAIENQLRQDVETAAQENLPPLPEDMSTLPDLKPGDITAGAILACKFFSVNPITITPEISNYKTAIVDREGDSGHGAGTIRLKIAQRDLPKREKKFDSRGNRIYDAADQFYMEDDDEEEGLCEVHFGELLEPKLLQAA
jgi:hypothetical protein